MSILETPAYKDRVDVSKVKDICLVEFAARDAQEEVFRAFDDRSLDLRATGCGRVYVNFGKLRANSKKMKVIERELSKLSIRGLSCRKFTRRPHSSYMQFYVGYDNNSGVEMAVGKIIADTFNKHGFHAYMDADGD